MIMISMMVMVTETVMVMVMRADVCAMARIAKIKMMMTLADDSVPSTART